MSEAEMRQVLKSILEAGMIGRLHPEAKAKPGTGPLLIALGTIAGLATIALEGANLPPERLELTEEEFDQLNAGGVIPRQTKIGYRVELAVAE